MWIEIQTSAAQLKCLIVTPLAGVWIEIRYSNFQTCQIIVTPLAGVWIEIKKELYDMGATGSLPLRECGLKWT